MDEDALDDHGAEDTIHRGGIPYNGPVNVTILFFASVADRVGARRIEMPHEPGDTVASVRDRIVTAYPALAGFVPTLLYALNEEYVRTTDPVPAGSTLALIPPVSGG